MIQNIFSRKIFSYFVRAISVMSFQRSFLILEVINLIFIYANLFLLGLHSLPNDYRSLLHTPRQIEISQVGGGQLWYNGIATNLQNIFSKLNEDITIGLNFNMDGLPLFKSSQRCFWPILASINGKY